MRRGDDSPTLFIEGACNFAVRLYKARWRLGARIGVSDTQVTCIQQNIRIDRLVGPLTALGPKPLIRFTPKQINP